jgi:hypothetical protein
VMKERGELKTGSALLLTVMVISVLTTTTLGVMSIRFDQLSATRRIIDSNAAKAAADSGLAALREQLTSGSVTTTAFNLNNNSADTNFADSTDYRPNPRNSVYSIEPTSITLPRCLSVAVLNPWLSNGSYYYDSNSGGGATLFHYLNTYNQKTLGSITGNESLSDEDKALTVGYIAGIGNFDNPYAPSGVAQSTSTYWMINFNGPEDQFLTRDAVDGVSSYYGQLDLLYVPYLPRFLDGPLKNASGGWDLKTKDEIRTQFEQRIQGNNFRVWLDASAGFGSSESTVYQYGLGDLFPTDENNRVTWVQPSLWNDLAEKDYLGAYFSNTINNTKVTWEKRPLPTYDPGGVDSGWKTEILRGSVPLAFTGAPSTNIGSGLTINVPIYGPLSGLRIGKAVGLRVYRTSGSDNTINNATITGITTGSSPSLRLALPSSISTMAASSVKWITVMERGDLAYEGPQVSTTNSAASASIQPGGKVVTLASPSSCLTVICPAVGDLVNLTKSGVAPVWGQVAAVNYSSNQLQSYLVDELRRGPKPIQDFAYTTITSGGQTRMAVYGGRIVVNGFYDPIEDGHYNYDYGLNSEVDELWIYEPSSNQWQYVDTRTGGAQPGKRTGSSMTYDASGNRLVLFGGYYREALNCGSDTTNYESCLTAPTPNTRLARRVNNDLFTLTPPAASPYQAVSWAFTDKVGSAGSNDKIKNNEQYKVRLVSTLADRTEAAGSPTVTTSFSGQMLANGTSQTIPISSSSSLAGFSKGDNIRITNSSGTSLAWARLLSVDYASKSVQIKVYGYGNGSTASFAVTNPRLVSVSRETVDNVCTGSTSGNVIRCQINTSATGLSVGDGVVLERIQSNRLDRELSGYIRNIDSSSFYFVADERNSEIADFTLFPSTSSINDQSVVAVPSSRYGASLQTMSPSGFSAQLWQGSQSNGESVARFSDVWTLDSSLNWTVAALEMPNPYSVSSGARYSFQVFETGADQYVFSTKDNSNGAITKSGPNWDNGTVWSLLLENINEESLSVLKISKAARITLERNTGSAIETFHGVVRSFDEQTNRLTFVHDSDNSYAGDSGFVGDSKNVKIFIDYSLEENQTFGNGNTTAAATVLNDGRGTVRMTVGVSGCDVAESARQCVDNIPPVGSTIFMWDDNTPTVPTGAYIFTITDRSYTVNKNAGGTIISYTFDFQGTYSWPLASAPSQTYLTNQLSRSSANVITAHTFGTTLLHEATSFGGGHGGAEWIVRAAGGSGSQIWKMRKSGYDSVTQRPAPRRDAASSSYFDGTKTIQYVTGGMAGVYGTVWKLDNAQDVSSSPNQARWLRARASAKASEDIPAMMGGALVVYGSSGNPPSNAIFFGGKHKLDRETSDYMANGGVAFQGRDKGLADGVKDGAYGVSMLSQAEQDSKLTSKFTGAIIDPSNYKGPDINGIKNSFELSYDHHTNYSAGCSTSDLSVGQSLGNSCRNWRLGHLGDLGVAYNDFSNFTLNLINPGDRFTGSDGKDLVFSAPSIYMRSNAGTSGYGTGDRSHDNNIQDGYYPSVCDVSGCQFSVPWGTATNGGADANDFSKTLMLAGFAKLQGGGWLLATSLGIGSNKTEAEDLLFSLNAMKVFSTIDTYKVTGYYGGVKRGYLVVPRSVGLGVQEIVP